MAFLVMQNHAECEQDHYPDIAVVELTDEKIEELRDMVESACLITREGFNRISFFDWSVDYYFNDFYVVMNDDGVVESDIIMEAVWNRGYIIYDRLPACFDPEKAARVEATTVNVDKNSFYWKAYLKNCNRAFTTEIAYLSTLEFDEKDIVKLDDILKGGE